MSNRLTVVFNDRTAFRVGVVPSKGIATPSVKPRILPLRTVITRADRYGRAGPGADDRVASEIQCHAVRADAQRVPRARTEVTAQSGASRDRRPTGRSDLSRGRSPAPRPDSPTVTQTTTRMVEAERRPAKRYPPTSTASPAEQQRRGSTERGRMLRPDCGSWTGRIPPHGNGVDTASLYGGAALYADGTVGRSRAWREPAASRSAARGRSARRRRRRSARESQRRRPCAGRARGRSPARGRSRPRRRCGCRAGSARRSARARSSGRPGPWSATSSVARLAVVGGGHADRARRRRESAGRCRCRMRATRATAPGSPRAQHRPVGGTTSSVDRARRAPAGSNSAATARASSPSSTGSLRSSTPASSRLRSSSSAARLRRRRSSHCARARPAARASSRSSSLALEVLGEQLERCPTARSAACAARATRWPRTRGAPPPGGAARAASTPNARARSPISSRAVVGRRPARPSPSRGQRAARRGAAGRARRDQRRGEQQAEQQRDAEPDDGGLEERAAHLCRPPRTSTSGLRTTSTKKFWLSGSGTAIAGPAADRRTDGVPARGRRGRRVGDDARRRVGVRLGERPAPWRRGRQSSTRGARALLERREAATTSPVTAPGPCAGASSTLAGARASPPDESRPCSSQPRLQRREQRERGDAERHGARRQQRRAAAACAGRQSAHGPGSGSPRRGR